ncbi:Clp protease N-terminal domain-containing protein [Actinocorallia populi]|uniref:Clp protease N-terminal domain-containing protein n=1 Tax=Actinocorallia populi TaxID=2079200 RepID=UPI000D094A41|nr:Clp protease N-terminal domain-containing protein [Actinocorallia populi]
MTVFSHCAPDTRRTIVRAGVLADEAGGALLGTEHLLLALAEDGSLAGAEISPDTLRTHLPRSRRDDRALLAALGIDLDEVRRRAEASTFRRLDDPSLWSLRRSRLRPLRVTLTGPAAALVLDAHARKSVEVARWAARRARRPLVGREDLLWGLLADGTSPSVRLLRRLDVDLCALWAGLRARHEAA